MLPSSTCDVTSDIRLLLVEPPFSNALISHDAPK